MIVVAKYFLIAMAVILAPVYGAWIWIGSRMDRAGQRRYGAVLKGRLWIARERLNK